MDKDNKHSDWNKPLTKADFRLYQFEKHIGIYTAVCWIAFVLCIVMAGDAIYNFLSGYRHYGIDKLFYSVLCFLVGRGALKEFGKLRDEQNQIQNNVLKYNE